MALAELDAHIHRANTNISDLLSVFFDLENAFPRVWHHFIPSTLYKLGLPGALLCLLQNYLSDRIFHVRVAVHLSTRHSQKNGVPQGFPLSGTLFMVALDGIFSTMNHPLRR